MSTFSGELQVASKLIKKEIRLHAWVYKFETGIIFKYDEADGQFKQLVERQSFKREEVNI